MDSGYKLADLKRDENGILDKISSLEADISDKTGQDIVLIAYTGNTKTK